MKDDTGAAIAFTLVLVGLCLLFSALLDSLFTPSRAEWIRNCVVWHELPTLEDCAKVYDESEGRPRP